MNYIKKNQSRVIARRSPSRKLCDFSYLLQRKCLRMMRRYYKNRFEESDIDQLEHSIRQFIEIEFDYLLGFQEYINYMKLEECLKTLILCDRYNKCEPIIEGLQFEIVRNVLNKFNTRNLIEFLSDKSYALLFVNYFEKASENDCLNQREIDPERLKQEMNTLYDEADKYVQISLDHFKGFFRPFSPIFPYINQYEYSFE